jgi:hypothetical protein
MTTIFVINAASSSLAAAAIGALLVRQSRRARRELLVQPLYVTAQDVRSPGRRFDVRAR